MPNPDTEDTRAGTAAHWVMADKLTALVRHHKAGTPMEQLDTDCTMYLGRQAPNGVIVDEGIAEGAQVMVDDVMEVCRRFDCLRDLLIEHRVYMPKIHPENWGTLDAGVYLPQRRVLFLWDYKNRRGTYKQLTTLTAWRKSTRSMDCWNNRRPL